MSSLHTPRRGYPLSALFLLIAACSVILALLSESGSRHGETDLFGVAIAGGVIGGIFGAISGSFQPKPIRSTIIGYATGTFLGGPAGYLMIAPPSLVSVAVACAILLTVGFAMRKLA